jgi:threonine synthase
MKLKAWYECFRGCGVRYELDRVVYRCEKCDGLLEVRHDMDALRQRSAAEWRALFDARQGRESGVWSKKELVLPNLNPSNIVSLGEGNTPLIRSDKLARTLGLERIYIKQCGTSHTGSFKDLGMTVLVSMVNEIRHKVRAVACASTGDTSAALACYCAAAGIPSIVFLPSNKISTAQLIQPMANGAITVSIDTDFDGCMKIVQEVTRDGSIYLANSLNSLRIEGQKTISFEIVQQLNWRVPDFVVVPGGNLGNISAVGNGFLQMREMGLIERIPRLVCAQTEQANPLYLSFRGGFDRLAPVPAGTTLATAIQIGNPVSFEKAVRVLKATDGLVEQASESELAYAASSVDRYGFFNDPQTGVALAATMKLTGNGTIPKGSSVVVISTAHGLKFIDFKVQFHNNPPVEVPPSAEAVLAALAGRLPA